MKQETTLVHVFGGPEHLVQHVRTAPKTITVCPLCKVRLKGGDTTVLVELMKSLPFTQGDRRHHEFDVRIDLCARCAEPVVRQKRETMNELCSLFAELVTEEVWRQMEQQRRVNPRRKKSEHRQVRSKGRKHPSDERVG